MTDGRELAVEEKYVIKKRHVGEICGVDCVLEGGQKIVLIKLRHRPSFVSVFLYSTSSCSLILSLFLLPFSNSRIVFMFFFFFLLTLLITLSSLNDIVNSTYHFGWMLLLKHILFLSEKDIPSSFLFLFFSALNERNETKRRWKTGIYLSFLTEIRGSINFF